MLKELIDSLLIKVTQYKLILNASSIVWLIEVSYHEFVCHEKVFGEDVMKRFSFKNFATINLTSIFIVVYIIIIFMISTDYCYFPLFLLGFYYYWTSCWDNIDSSHNNYYFIIYV